jgi:3-oxoacyl-[acyl-carrier-protein] synthase-1
MTAATHGRGSRIVLTGHHAITPVGLDAELTCAALRAGVARMAECDLYLPMAAGPEVEEDDALVAALVPELDTELDGIDRLLALGLGALRGLVERTGLLRADLPRTGLFVALPAPDAATRAWKLGDYYMPQLIARAGFDTFAKGQIAADEGGHSGVLSLIGRAMTALEAGIIDQAIVLGVDSYIDVARLHALDEAYRLKSQRGVDGFVPGEAAVALLIERSAPGRPARRPVLAQLALPGQATEPRPQTGDKGSTGAGLATALREAFQSLPQRRPVAWVLCDLNGESYRAFEWGLVQVRLREHFAGGLAVRHPANCIGDTGAASGALLIACAAQAFARKYAGDEVATIWTASDGGARSAMLVFPPEGSR